VPPNSLRDLNVDPKMKQWKKKRIRACSQNYTISRVGGCVGVLGWD